MFYLSPFFTHVRGAPDNDFVMSATDFLYKQTLVNNKLFMARFVLPGKPFHKGHEAMCFFDLD